MERPGGARREPRPHARDYRPGRAPATWNLQRFFDQLGALDTVTRDDRIYQHAGQLKGTSLAFMESTDLRLQSTEGTADLLSRVFYVAWRASLGGGSRG
ncbi:MAG: hypothetical protein AB7N76_07730 [Planctomycetota bacterium]